MLEIDNTRAQRLKKIKRIATGLLVLVALIFAGSKVGAHYYTWKGWGAIIAFSEASMVGALADWFAVVALFHHPLGLPIPHTNLVVQNQQRLGDNMGNFVKDNFLSEALLKEKISRLKISSWLLQWIESKENIEKLEKQIAEVLVKVIENLDERNLEKFIERNAQTILQKIEPAQVVGKLGNYIFEKQVHQMLLTEVLILANRYVKQNEDFIQEQIKENAKIIPSFLNSIITKKIIQVVDKNLENIAKNEDHSVRVEFDFFVLTWLEKLRTEPSYIEKAIMFRTEMIDKIDLERQSKEIYKTVKNNILQEITKPDTTFNKKIVEMLQKAFASEEFQQKADTWAQEKLLKIALENQHLVSEHISQTVKKWDKNDLSNKLEAGIGRDLQFIRINGTLVGGCIGLVLYLIFEILLKL